MDTSLVKNVDFTMSTAGSIDTCYFYPSALHFNAFCGHLALLTLSAICTHVRIVRNCSYATGGTQMGKVDRNSEI